MILSIAAFVYLFVCLFIYLVIFHLLIRLQLFCIEGNFIGLECALQVVASVETNVATL